jgi:heterotetrameric sarcosine oxidase gamma subunit
MVRRDINRWRVPESRQVAVQHIVTESPLRIVRFSPRNVSLLQFYGSRQEEGLEIATRFAADSADSNPLIRPRVYAIGPTEWLLIDCLTEGTRRILRASAERVSVRITDVSAEFASLKIEGSAARAVLLSDMAPSGTIHCGRPGEYVRTHLGQIEVILQCVATDVFELHVARSLVDDLESWIKAQYCARFPASSASSQ